MCSDLSLVASCNTGAMWGGRFHLFSCSPTDRGWKEANRCLRDNTPEPKAPSLLCHFEHSLHMLSYLCFSAWKSSLPYLSSHLFFKMQVSWVLLVVGTFGHVMHLLLRLAFFFPLLQPRLCSALRNSSSLTAQPWWSCFFTLALFLCVMERILAE